MSVADFVYDFMQKRMSKNFLLFWALILMNNWGWFIFQWFCSWLVQECSFVLLAGGHKMIIIVNVSKLQLHETPQASFLAFSSPLYNTLSSSVDVHKPCSSWKLAKEFPLFMCVCECLFVCLQASCDKLSPFKFFQDHLELLYIVQNPYFSLSASILMGRFLHH